MRRQLYWFFGTAALALLVVAGGAVVASRSVAREQALTDAERMTSRLAQLVVGPLLGAALAGDAGRYHDLVQAFDLRMQDGYLTQVAVFDADGRVLFADDPVNAGTRVDPHVEVTAAITNHVVTSGFEDHPETGRFTPEETAAGLVEVYVPLDVQGQPPLAFEAYYDNAGVDEIANSLLRKWIPLVLVPLLVLVLIQVPIASSMARRVRRDETERADLLERSLKVSERERIRFAADLHDGPIQDLAGIGYVIGAAAALPPDQRQTLMGIIESTVLRTIESLRQLMVDLYPPDLSVAQLPTTLSSLAAPLRDQGISVDLTVDPLPEMSVEVVTTLYRVANEALANVAEHANARNVRISLRLTGPIGSRGAEPGSAVCLQIVDDGIGFDAGKLDRRSEGHLGLRLLRSRVQDLGGTFSLTANPPGGTILAAVLPVGGSTTSR